MPSTPSSISVYNFTQRVHDDPSAYKLGFVQKSPLFYEEVSLDFESEKFEGVYAELPPGKNYDRVFNPFRRYPGLYRTIADCQTDNDSILEFIRTYGFLTKPIQLSVNPAEKMKGKLSKVDMSINALIKGESLHSLRQQFSDMRKAVVLLECLQNYISGSGGVILSDVLKKKDDNTWAFFHTPDKPWHDVVRDVDSFSIEQVAITQFQMITNRHLSDNAAPRLFVDADALRSGRSFSRPRLYLNPLSLAGVAWIQVAQAMSNSDDLARCSECGTWFSRNIRNGKDKLYCSGACRTRAARRRAKATS